MLVEALKDQWICSCGNWVDLAFHWCPDCCAEKLQLIHGAEHDEEETVQRAT